ncbi:MAG TPA: N-acetyltransferase, partial [Telluria sp.]|nr:N-acetyltransferase [Telluria sp.]
GFRREPRIKILHRGDIFGVYVAPAARGTGIARKLLEALLDHVRTLPEMVVVNLSVRTNNDSARALYRRLGFAVTGIDKRAIFADGAYHDEERMALDLDGNSASAAL